MESSAGAFMSSVKVGPKGQIVIPKEIRDMFAIKPGDSLLIMAAPDRGIAIQRQEVLMEIADAIYAGRGKEVYPNEDPAHLPHFAEAIRKAGREKGDKDNKTGGKAD